MRAGLIAAMGLVFASAGSGLAQVRTSEATPDSTTETFGDWTVACSTAPATKERVCEVGITIAVRGQSAPIARVALGRRAKDKPMRIVALVPANVAIAPGVSIAAETGKTSVSLPYRSCMPGGCLAEIDLGKDQIQAFRNREKPGQLTFSDPSGKPVALELSFKGLDQALDALAKR